MMYTTSTLSKNSSIQETNNINALSFGEKAIIIEMFQNPLGKEQTRLNFTYTIKPGDEKRLNRSGVLRVYDLNKPVNIPVVKLLGKWKKTHIGVTLVIANGIWCIADSTTAEKSMYKQGPAVQVAFQRLLKFVMA